MKKGELVARLEAQELDAQKKSALAQRDQALAQLANARLDRTRARQLLEEKIGTQQAFDTADSQVKALEAQVSAVRSPGPLLRRADQERRDLRAHRRRRDREEGVPRRNRRAAGLRRGRLGRRDVRDHRGPLLARDGGRHQRAERRQARPRATGRGRARRVSGQALQGAPPPDRADGRPPEGLGQGEDRAPRQGREGPPRDVLPGRVPEPAGEDRREGEAEGHGAVGLRRRGGRREGRPPRRERQGRVQAARARPRGGRAGGGDVGRFRAAKRSSPTPPPPGTPGARSRRSASRRTEERRRAD